MNIALHKSHLGIVLCCGSLAAGIATVAAHGSAAATSATTCFTVTVTNTPLQPAPGATVCLPVDLPR